MSESIRALEESSAAGPEALPIEETEAYKTLLSRAHRKTGSIPESTIVKHVLSVTNEADWPVQREAMEALLRRFSFGQKDRLKIETRPAGGEIYGVYGTRRQGSSSRPYHTLLESVELPRGSCDCPDFLRGSLGLCKHLLAVLEDVAARPRTMKQALLDRAESCRSPLAWHPVRPLTGPGDWLEQVRWVDGTKANDDTLEARRWFHREDKGKWIPRDAYADRPRHRLQMVEDLYRAVTAPKSVADPALRTLLKEERERLERVIRDAETARDVAGALRTLKQKLYPYQSEGVKKFVARGRLLLADDMGLGKTAQAIAACHALWNAHRVRRGLLVVPAALKPQWLREWQIFTDTPAAIAEGTPEERRRAFRSHKSGFLIINYEQLLRDLEDVHGWNPDMVVLDEAQRIKNWATKTATYVKKLDPPYRLVLTGTPMENRIEELASIMDWVDDFALEPKWRLVPWHSTPSDGRGEVKGVRNLETLRCRLAGSMVRRLRKDVLLQLPARTDTRVPVEMTPEQKAEHDELILPILRLVSIARKRPLTQAQFLRLMMLLATQRIISNGLAQLRFEEMWPDISGHMPSEAILKSLSTPKLAELRELIGQVVVQQKRKVVVFSQWRRMLLLANWAVRDILEGCGARAAFFTGHEGQKRRTQNIVEFHDDPDVRVLFASDAGGVGLNLQRAASCCINMELPWNPAVLEQRIGRIYRIGQKRPIDVYNLICEEGIESRIAALVDSKLAFFKGLFDGTSNEVVFERSGGFLSRIEKLVEPVTVPDLPKAAEESGEGDAAAEKALDRVLAASDESKDSPAAPETESAPNVPAAGAREVASPAPPSQTQVERLFSQLKVRPTQGGGLVIEATPETASTLAALFSGMAKMLQSAAGGPG